LKACISLFFDLYSSYSTDSRTAPKRTRCRTSKP